MPVLTDAEIDAAFKRGRTLQAKEPRAETVRYDQKRDRIVIDLTDGSSIAFPPRLVEGLADASAAALAEVQIPGAGFGLHWEALDVDYTVPGLLSGLCGTRRHLARLAGRTTSPAKAAAARSNGARGGRPRKAAIR